LSYISSFLPSTNSAASQLLRCQVTVSLRTSHTCYGVTKYRAVANVVISANFVLAVLVSLLELTLRHLLAYHTCIRRPR